MAETSGLSSLPSRRGRLRGGDPTKIKRDRAKALADVAANKDMSTLDKAALVTATLPVIGDIVYDHFLAKNFSDYSKQSLFDFSQKSYSLFRKRWDELPVQIQHMLKYMEAGNWLYNYRSKEGLNSALSGMGRRASFSNKMHQATEDVFENYESFKSDFVEFFPELQNYISLEIQKIQA